MSLKSLPPTLGLRGAQLPDIHKAPADRIIIATALLHNHPVVTDAPHFPHTASDNLLTLRPNPPRGHAPLSERGRPARKPFGK